MRSVLVLLVLFAIPGIAPAQGKKNTDPIKVIALSRTAPVVYEKDIEPILANKCQFCHSGPVKEGKLDLGSYEAMMRGGKSGKPIVPGKADESLLVKLSAKVKKPLMPPKSEDPLTPEELALIKLWVDQGAKPPSGARERPKVVLGLTPPSVHPVRSVAISPDKSALAAGRANQIHVYDAGSGAYIRALVDPGLAGPDGKPLRAAHLAIVESLAYSPDGKYLASGSFQGVTVWDAKTGLIRYKLGGFVDRVVALAFSPDGKFLATGGGAPTEDGELKVFTAADGKPVCDIKNGHSDTVFGVCFSPDSTKLASCGADKFVKVFEVPAGKLVKPFEGHTHHVLDVGWSFDGKRLASCGADNAVKLWDYEKGEQVQTLQGHTKQVTRLQFMGTSPRFVTCGADNQVKYWDVNNGGNFMNFAGKGDFLYAVGVSRDGALVASGGDQGIVWLYNGTNGQLVKELLPPGVTPPPAVVKK